MKRLFDWLVYIRDKNIRIDAVLTTHTDYKVEIDNANTITAIDYWCGKFHLFLDYEDEAFYYGDGDDIRLTALVERRILDALAITVKEGQ